MDGQLHHLQTLLRHVSLCADTRPDLMTLAVTQKIIDQLSAMHLAPVAVVILTSQRCIIPKSIIASLDVDRLFKALEALGDNDDDDGDRDGDQDRDHIEESSAMQWMEALRMIHNDSIDHAHSEAAISDVRHLTDHGLDRHSSSQQILAQIGLDLISLLYHIPASSSAAAASSRRRRRDRLAQLRTEHFNIVLRLAMLAGDHGMVVSLFHLMHPLNDDNDDDGEEAASAAIQKDDLLIDSEGVLTTARNTYSTTTSTTTTSSTSSRSSDLDSVSSSVDPVFFIPNTFTIAELIRCARVSTDIDLLSRVVVWSVQHMVYVPIGLISDAISILYRYALFLID